MEFASTIPAPFQGRKEKAVEKSSASPRRWIFADAKGGKARGVGWALTIILLSLAIGVAVSVGPPLTKAWLLSILSVVISALAAVKFAASSIIVFQRGKLFLALLWGALAVAFVLHFIVALQYLIEFIEAPK